MAEWPVRDFVRVGRSRIEGKGVFAKRKIPKGTRIIEYTGERVPVARLFAESGGDPRAHVYLFHLREDIAVDGARNGNDARFINHSCDPNCEAYIFDDRIWIYAMRDIPRHEELTFDYQLGPAFPGNRKNPSAEEYRCLCGSPNCRGTILPAKRGRKARISS